MPLLSSRFFALVLLWSAPLAYSQEPKTQEPKTSDDIRSIRQMLEQQGHQLDTLTQQVAKLSQLVETSHSISPGASPAAQNMPPVQETSQTSQTNPTPSATPEAPRAEAVDIGTTHVVSRGETLTSIARQYKVTVGDLQKVNNIRNDRTLQIGQTLTIPSAKAGDSHKKEKQ